MLRNLILLKKHEVTKEVSNEVFITIKLRILRLFGGFSSELEHNKYLTFLTFNPLSILHNSVLQFDF